jgi:AcrR family transcriptional regulator
MAEKSESHRRREILQVAASLFRHHGYERTSVRQIADALGIKSGSLFYHFASKEEILVAVMEEGIRDVFGAVQAGVANERDLPHRLLAMVRCHLGGLLGSNLDALMVLVYEWRSLSAPAMRRVLEWRNRYEDLWDRELSAAAARRWVDADTLLVRQTVLGALNWTGQWYRSDRRLQVDELALRMFELLFPRLFALLDEEAAVQAVVPTGAERGEARFPEGEIAK